MTPTCNCGFVCVSCYLGQSGQCGCGCPVDHAAESRSLTDALASLDAPLAVAA